MPCGELLENGAAHGEVRTARKGLMGNVRTSTYLQEYLDELDTSTRHRPIVLVDR